MADNDKAKPVLTTNPKTVQNKPLNNKTVPAEEPKPKAVKPYAIPVEKNPIGNLIELNPVDLVKGFIFSQILDKPRCRQRGRW